MTFLLHASRLTKACRERPRSAGDEHRPRAGAREIQDERGALADLAGDADLATELLDNLSRDGEAQTEAAPLGGDEVLEDCGEALRRDTAAAVLDPDQDAVRSRLRLDDDHAAGRGRLDGVENEVAVDAAEREHVPFDEQRLCGQLVAQRDA